MNTQFAGRDAAVLDFFSCGGGAAADCGPCCSAARSRGGGAQSMDVDWGAGGGGVLFFAVCLAPTGSCCMRLILSQVTWSRARSPIDNLFVFLLLFRSLGARRGGAAGVCCCGACWGRSCCAGSASLRECRCWSALLLCNMYLRRFFSMPGVRLLRGKHEADQSSSQPAADSLVATAAGRGRLDHAGVGIPVRGARSGSD